MEIPNENYDWNCKYVIQTSQSIIDSINKTDELNDKGYLYVEGQQNGFDEEVWLITQPRNQYHDYNQEHPKNNETKVFKSTPGRKFLIPAEYDVLILFHPLRNTAGSENEFNKSPSGSFDIKAQY